MPAGLTPTSRVESFSDGVLAVAITLLVLNLRVPVAGAGGSAWHALVVQWPAYAAFVTSFLTVGIMWVNHHSLFRQIAFADRALLFANLVLLMLIVVTPFSTSFAAAYLTEKGFDAHVAMAFYDGVFVLVALAFAGLWGYALLHPALLEPTVAVPVARRSYPRFAFGALVYLGCVGIAFLSPLLALLVTLALAVYYAFEHLPAARSASRAP